MFGEFKKQAFKKNEKNFGKEKMKALFEVFIETKDEGISKIEPLMKEGDRESIRLIFHTLKSSALVFGIDAFAKAAGKIEDKIIAGENLICLEKEIKKAKILLREGIKKAKEYLNG